MNYWIKKIFLAFLAVHSITQAAGIWLPVKDVSLIVEQGSILDFSMINSVSEPTRIPLIINRNGRFAKKDEPAKPLRFLMGSLGFGVATGSFPSHAMADLYVRQFRMHGYNMARLDFVEETLMHERAADFDFNPEQMDRLHYLLFALKREGLYYMLNGLSSDNGAYGNIKDRWINQRNVKLGVYYDVEKQRHWKSLMEKLFLRINPYTGLSILNDPALAGVILVNEGGLAFATRNQAPNMLKPQFALWLKKKYGNTTNLARAWKGELAVAESIEYQSIDFPDSNARTSNRMADTQKFFLDLEKTTADWMTSYLRELGYNGMATSYNNHLSPAAHASRSQFDWVDMHNYYSEPTDGIESGSMLRQDSMLQGAASYIRDLSVSRHVGKAFTVSEFGQVFWNKFRRETGLALPAYAAFQGWDVISQHAHAISLSYESGNPRLDLIGPFNVAHDPVARAGETLAALLYARGDVAQTQHMVGISPTPKFVFYDNAQLGNIPPDLSLLSLVTGVGLTWQGRVSEKCDAQVTTENASVSFPSEDLGLGPAQQRVMTPSSFISDYKNKFASKIDSSHTVVDRLLASRLDALKRKGLIRESNVTDPATGIYETDTEQILLDSKRNILKVVTPNTEAVVFEKPEVITLNNLKVEYADGPAMVSVSSMDGHPLKTSRRMLLILATDARNSGMQFADVAETTLLDFGKKPVLIRAAIVKLKLMNSRATELKIFSNTLRGKRGDIISTIQEADGISFTLNTSILSHGPTTYFEITGQE